MPFYAGPNTGLPSGASPAISQGLSFTAGSGTQALAGGQALNIVVRNPSATRFITIDQFVISYEPNNLANPQFLQGGRVPNASVAGLTAVPLEPRFLKTPPMVSSGEFYFGVGAPLNPNGSILYPIGALASDSGTIVGPLQSMGFSFSAPAPARVGFQVYLHERKTVDPAPCERGAEFSFFVPAQPGWFATYIPPGTNSQEIAPIALWVTFQDGDIRGFIADETGRVRDVHTLSGFGGYIPPTGKGIVVQ